MEKAGRKQELFDLLREERRRWEALLSQVGETRMEIAGVVGEWSVKDIIAHLAAWEARPVAWLDAIRQGTAPQPPPWDPTLTEEQVNAWIYQQSRSRALGQVLDDSSHIHARLVDLLHGIAEKDLVANSRYTWLGETALIDAIAGNSYEHYREHGAAIRVWLAQSKAKHVEEKPG